jgi:hypothetical protein
VQVWLETLAEAPPADALPALAYAAGLEIELGDDVHGATRRALLLLAAGGDPQRGLDLDGRAVAALAADLDNPARRTALAAGIAALAPLVAGLPSLAAAVERLAADPELAWRAYAAGVLADSLEDDLVGLC